MPFPAARVLLAAFALGGLRAPAQTLESVLARMDGAAAAFKGLEAHVRRISHTGVINENNVDTGAMRLKRSKRDIRMLVELTDPDPKSVALRESKVEVYYPKLRIVEEYDVGKNRELLDQFFLLGFGTSGSELASAYDIKVLGTETVSGQNATRLELIPRSKEILQHLKKLELWMAETGVYPVQQKFYLPAGDYMKVTYTNVRLNPLQSEADLKLKLPKDVKRVFPQK